MLLFVYGTLKSDERASGILLDAGGKYIGPATTVPRYRLFQFSWFPTMVEDETGVAVEGELWYVPDSGIATLDQYEGSGFRRTPIDLEKPEKKGDVIAYLFQGETVGLELCSAGSWKGSG